MSFTMSHLIIAKNISDKYKDHIKNLPQFYLGSIAPDAAHNRADYISDFKKHSHLITGSEKWGMTTENDKWKDNIYNIFKKHTNSENHDFILGYCTHALGDLYNNIAIWTAFREKYFKDKDWVYDNVHHRDSNRNDIELALTYKDRDILWQNLQMSVSIDFPDYIYASELDMQKELILNVWYKDKERPDISLNKERTFEMELDFIEKATDYVSLAFKDLLNENILDNLSVKDAVSDIVEESFEMAIDGTVAGEAIADGISEVTEAVIEKVTGFISGLIE